MGNPLSPLLADIVMEDLETECLKKLGFKPQCYYRYVDDTFLVIPAEKLDRVLKVFNKYHYRLQFTHEVECDNSMNFLDMTAIRNDTDHIITNWYRKKIYSGRYLNFFF